MKAADDAGEREGAACFCLAARQAARAVTDLYDLVLSPAGLKATQFTLLRAIAQQGGLSQQQLGSELAVAPETMSRRLAALKAAGWIELKALQTGRGRVYVLTESGRARIHDASAYWNRAQARLRLCLGPRDWRTAIALLAKVVAAARRAEAARIPNRTDHEHALFEAGLGRDRPAREDIKAVP
jgi:DNA-binding MarR family transcriptional regulator